MFFECGDFVGDIEVGCYVWVCVGVICVGCEQFLVGQLVLQYVEGIEQFVCGGNGLWFGVVVVS